MLTLLSINRQWKHRAVILKGVSEAHQVHKPEVKITKVITKNNIYFIFCDEFSMFSSKVVIRETQVNTTSF